MIVLDILSVLDDLKGEQRELVTSSLYVYLSTITMEVVLESFFDYSIDMSYNEFIKLQNELLVECIKLEMTKYGEIVRRSQGLPPLTMRTEIILGAYGDESTSIM